MTKRPLITSAKSSKIAFQRQRNTQLYKQPFGEIACRYSQLVREQYERLKDELNQHNHAYYVLDDPSPRCEHDRLMRRLQEIEAEFPALQRRLTLPAWGEGAISIYSG